MGRGANAAPPGAAASAGDVDLAPSAPEPPGAMANAGDADLAADAA